MGLDVFQHTLAKIYTDRDYRARYFSDPESVIASLNLQTSDAQQLLKLKKDQVEVFAQGLINKRFGAVKSLLPLSHQQLGLQFKINFQRYAEAQTLESGPHKHITDAIGYCDYLLNILVEEKFIRNIVKYERLINASSDIYKKVLWDIFSIPVHQIHLKNFNPATKRSTVILFIRLSPKSRLRRLVFV